MKIVPPRVEAPSAISPHSRGTILLLFLTMNFTTVTILFTWFCIIYHNVAVAYSTSAPTTILSTNIIKQQINHNSAEETNYDDVNVDWGDVEILQMKQSLLGRAYRRGKKLLTREKEDTTTKQQEEEEPEQLWRVMFHNSEYMPDRVARELTKVFPITRTTAFDICVRARSEGVVTVDITHKKQAEKYVRQLSKRGLVATIQPE